MGALDESWDVEFRYSRVEREQMFVKKLRKRAIDQSCLQVRWR